MISGIGIDIESTKEFIKSCKDKKFLDLIFTKKEKEYCLKKKEPYVSFTGKFCAKEALIKALNKSIPIKHIEVFNLRSKKVQIYIKRKIRKDIHCSISHTKEFASAFVIIEK